MKKHQRTISTGVVVLIGLLFAYFYKGNLDLGKTLDGNRPRQIVVPKEDKPEAKKTIEKKSVEKTQFRKKTQKRKPVLVKGPKGEEDISGTLDRIKRGEKFPHRNDGGIFRNREKRLPLEKRGYYHEFVHPTKGRQGPGAQRIVMGDEKETYYTPDHYETFQRVADVH